MTVSRDPRRRVLLALAIAVGTGGIVTLGLAGALAILPTGVAPAQRIGGAIVPTLVGLVALMGARRLWRAAQVKTT